MSAVFLLIDDVQDYDESLVILEVFPSLEEAQTALPLILAQKHPAFIPCYRTYSVERWEGTNATGRWDRDYKRDQPRSHWTEKVPA